MVLFINIDTLIIGLHKKKHITTFKVFTFKYNYKSMMPNTVHAVLLFFFVIHLNRLI